MALNGVKVLGVIVLVFMLVAMLNPLMDEVTDIGEDANATSTDTILYNTFPYLYPVFILCVVGAGAYWVWKG